jgi:uncharacterized protein (DUF1778 family)
MSVLAKEYARFDARLLKSQKLLFEKAAYLGGYRNLTDFVIHTAQEKAIKIIEENERIITSERDSQIFYDAITNPKEPSDALKKAYNDYSEFMANQD